LFGRLISVVRHLTMLIPVLILSCHSITYTVKPGHTAFDLVIPSSINLLLGRPYQAFILGDRTFFENSYIRLYESDFYQDFQHLLNESFGGIALISDSAVIDFVGNKLCHAEIWVIDENHCPFQSIVVSSSSEWSFKGTTPDQYGQVCIFPFRSPSRDVSFGSERGVATIFTPQTRRSCTGNVCHERVFAPFYAQFSGGGFSIEARGNRRRVEFCEVGDVAYFNLTAVAMPHFPRQPDSLSCELNVIQGDISNSLWSAIVDLVKCLF
jgi:hypothetical protein